MIDEKELSPRAKRALDAVEKMEEMIIIISDNEDLEVIIIDERRKISGVNYGKTIIFTLFN